MSVNLTSLRLRIQKQRQSAVSQLPIPTSSPSVAGFGPGVNNLGPDLGNPPRKQAVLVAGNDSFALDITDPVVSVSDLAAIEWTEIARARQAPWLVDSRRRLRKLAVKGMIYRQGTAIDFDIERIYYMTTLKTPVTFVYGAYEAGQYRITDLSVESQYREHGTNNITAANVSFTLTQASDPPVPRPVQTAPAPQPAIAATPPNAPARRTYTVKKGDTLWGISQQFYGNGAVYARIADANGIKDPRRLGTGQVLVIP